MTPVFPALQATHAFLVTASDTVDVKDDSANPDDASFVFLHNIAAGATVRVLPAGQGSAPVTVYIAQGQTLPLAVRRVYATTPAPPAGLLAFYSKGR
jgi:hypothetical protein